MPKLLHPNKIATMPTGYSPGVNTDNSQNIVNVSPCFVKTNFVEGTYQEMLVETNEKKGPFYQVCQDSLFDVQSTPNNPKERGHFCGLRMPNSPLDAKISWGIGEWNSAIYCREFLLYSENQALAIFCGRPHYLITGTADTYIEGAEIVINLNNNLANSILETKRWKWNQENLKWEPNSV